MNNTGQWLFEELGREIWNTCSEEYDTREEAIKAGLEYFEEELGDEFVGIFQIGQKENVTISVSGYSVCDQVSEDVGEQVGEVAEDFLYRLSKEELKLLNQMLSDTFNEWLEKTKNTPSFFKVVNTETVDRDSL